MRDGIELATTYAVPPGTGPFPALLLRVPYVHEWQGAPTDTRERVFLDAGFAVVAQLMRGQAPSGGVLDPFGRQSSDDGCDAIEWIAGQTWCDGNVGMYGSSYGGMTQYEAAVARPPALKAIAPAGLPLVGYGQIPWEHGKFRPHWVVWHGHDAAVGEKPPWDLVAKAMRARPLTKAPEILGQPMTRWWEWIAHPTHDTYWQERARFDEMCDTEVPALHISGWRDAGKRGILAYFEEKRRRRFPERQWLVMGPWTHAGAYTGVVDDGEDYGPDSVFDMDALLLEWHERWLRSDGVAMTAWPRVRAFALGRNEWHGFDDWPPAAAETRTLFLAEAGALTPAEPEQDGHDTYTYDPLDPIDTTKTQFSRGDDFDLSALLDRDDVLVYRTEPLDEEVVVAGHAELELWFSSSVGDTDVFCHTAVQGAGGIVRRLDTKPLRVTYREGWDTLEPKPLVPDEPTLLRFRFPQTFVALQPGERMFLLVASSWWPGYDLNPNTGRMPLEDDGTTVVARQTILYGTRHRSRLMLPTIALGQATRIPPYPSGGAVHR